MRYGDKVAVDGLSLTVERGTITAVLGPNGAGKTTTLETCEGYRTPAAGHGPGARPRPGPRAPRPAPPHRRDAPGRRRLERRAGDGDARPHRPPARRTRSTPRCSPTGSGWATAGGRRTAGSPAASSSASAWRWRSSAAPRSSSSTSRRRGWTRRRGVRPGSCSSELRGDGVTVVLTTHYMDEAERLADQIHIIDRGRLIASGTPEELTRGDARRRSGSSSTRSCPGRAPRPRCARPVDRRGAPSTASGVALDQLRLARPSRTCFLESTWPAQPRGRLPELTGRG